MINHKPKIIMCIVLFLFVLSLDVTIAQTSSSKLLLIETDTYEISLIKANEDFSGTASNQRQRKYQGTLQFISNRLEPGTEIITRDRFFIDNTFELEIRANDSVIDDVIHSATNSFFNVMEAEYQIMFDRNIHHSPEYELLIIDERLLREKVTETMLDPGVLGKVTVKNGKVKAEGVTLEKVAEILTNNTDTHIKFTGNFDSSINFEMDLRKGIEKINTTLQQKYGLEIY